MNLKTLPVFHADVYEKKKKEVTPMHLELGIFRPTPQCTWYCCLKIIKGCVMCLFL